MTTTTLVANDILGNQVLDGNMTLSSLSVHKPTLNIEGSVEVKGNVDVDNSTVNIVDALGQLILSENEQGRATVMRPNLMRRFWDWSHARSSCLPLPTAPFVDRATPHCPLALKG